MPSTSSSTRHLLVYYGHGEREALARHRRVVLQPGHHAEPELEWLAERGTQVLAYLSLSEDTGPHAEWTRPERNASWGGHYVDVAHPAWRRLLARRADEALRMGFAGLFLDTLDASSRVPTDRAPLLDLVRHLRERTTSHYLLANRGFDLLPELASLVDGFLFESFSTTWEDGYRALANADLLANVERLHLLRATGRDLFALDYADSDGLAAFARARAATHLLPLQIADRRLTRVG